jgi:enoyl-CoA hydratase/carnithine racemase
MDQQEIIMARLDTYKDKYRFIDLKREDGILQVTLHKNGGPAEWGAYVGGIHDELGDAFYRIGRDPDNVIVILTGSGDRFLTDFDFSEIDPDAGTPRFWDRIYKEGKDLLMNLLDIEVPVIGAVNGPAFIHAELLTMSDIVIAADTASFADKAHSPSGTVPGDGVHVWWPMLLGFNRARHFLLTGEEISAREAKALGFVAEVVDPAVLIERAWAVARELACKPGLMLRYTRAAFTQQIKRRMLDDLGYGLLLEASASMDAMRQSASPATPAA